MTLVTRQGKGSKVTIQEMDDNLTLLNKPQNNAVWVSQLSDLPTPVNSIITLANNVTYYITTNIDLVGNRLVCGINNTILGASSENCSLTSTGLGAGIPLLTATRTIVIRHILFKDVNTCLDINGDGVNPLALDWTGVNFQNIPNVGTIQDFDNFIFNKGALLTCGNLRFNGSYDTVAFENSLFVGNGTGTKIIELLSDSNISRRFRIIYSSFVVFGSDIGIDYNNGVTIPVESFILDTVNFSGGGNYINGITSENISSFWVNCDGIQNSAELAYYTMNGNSTITDIVTQNVAVKIAGATIEQPITQKFTCTNNRATYIGGLQRTFKVTAVLSAISGNNNQIGVYISKNGVLINESEIYATTTGNGRAESIKVQSIQALNTDDYIEIWIENSTSTADITVQDLSVIVEALN